MMPLVFLFQVAPFVPVCTDADVRALSIGDIIKCEGAVLVPHEQLDKRGADLLACERRLEGAEESAKLLRGMPEALERSFRLTLAEMRTETQRERAASLARIIEAVTPEPDPWWRSPWLWGGIGAAVGGFVVWGVTR